MDQKLQQYLTDILPASGGWALELEEQASLGHVPIMDRAGMNFLTQIVRLAKPRTILEVGTAIGYSALRMHEAWPDSKIVSIEKDEIRYEQALENIRKIGRQENIEVILGDALEELPKLQGQNFDLVFIDAAKGQYRRFFDMAAPLLNNSGIIVSDNVLFRGYVADPVNVPKKYRNMVEKIRSYNEMLMNHPDFETTILPIGDGVAVSYKVSKKEGVMQQ